jgi:Flp pilus assembly protein TadB
MATSDRSIAEVLQDVLRNLQEIIRSEVRLVKTEAREEIGKAKSAGLLVGVGAVCGLFAAFFLLLTIVCALAIVLPYWAAALIVAVVLAIVASLVLNAGLKQFKRVHPVPDKTIESVKENVEWAKQQTK